MAARTDIFDLERLRLTPGQGRRLDLDVHLDDFNFGGQAYTVEPAQVPVRVDVSRMTSQGYSLRLRFDAAVEGPCMRCLAPAHPALSVDAREVNQPNGGEELDSPYVNEDEELDLHAWARDALALALPAQIVCRAECAGLCPQCGENLNDNPHEHEREPDPRWAALRDLKLDG